ncbi:MAG: hypothetical protein Q8L48_29310 [Archangium sp.]|nr:hypothetical protein [Archangium sp.]
MRALVLLSVVSLAGCVDLDRPRAFRCDDDTGCVGGWVCLKDRFCHDPSIGADVTCTTRADCTGGWFCGQEGKCLDPSRPAAFTCDDDTQCASPWRCSSERRCVDLSQESAGRAFNPAAAPARLRSPLTSPADLVRTSPPQQFESDGLPHTVWESALVRDSTLERAVLVGQAAPWGSGFSTLRYQVDLPEPPADVAVVAGAVLVQHRSGALTLLTSGQPAVPLSPGFRVEQLVPLAWNDASGVSGSAFAAVGEGQALFITPDGTSALLNPGVIDVTAAGFTEDAGGEPVLVVLRPGDGGEQVFFEVPSQAGKAELLVDLATLDGGSTPLKRAVRLRFEGGAIAVSFEDSAGITAQYVPTLVCAGLPCDGGVVPGYACGQQADFALPGTDQVRTACSDPGGGADLLYDSSAGGQFDFFEARPAHRSWGTSGGHVRHTAQGQLSWSRSLDTEVTDVLSVRPEVFGVLEGELIAVHGQDLYSEAPVLDGGLPLGLSLFARLDPGVVARPVAFIEGSEGLELLENGAVLSGAGSNDFPFALPVDPEPQGTLARMVLQPDGGEVLVVTTRDALYAGVEEEGGVVLLSATLRPAPGFPINDWALRAADGGFLEGWVVANNRLFRVTASTVERWKSSEVAVSGRDPLGVWFSGAAVQLGTASGEVLALPSRVRLVPPLLDGVTGMTGLCGAVFATTPDAVWEVVPADAGLGSWRELAVPGLFLPRLHRSGTRLFVVDEDGVVLELPVSCP